MTQEVQITWQQAKGDIEKALFNAFEAQELLEEMGGASHDLRELAKRIDRVCRLLDRPWPHMDGATSPSGRVESVQ